MVSKIFLISFALLSVHVAKAQDQWSLQQCLEYGLTHNNRIKSSQVNSRIKDVNFAVSRNQRLPTVDANVNQVNYFGRGPSRDGTYTDNNKITANINLSLDWTVFNGFKTKHTIHKNKCDLMASIEDTNSLKFDISVNITSSYLQVLLCKELLAIARAQVKISNEILKKAKALHSMGKNTQTEVAEAVATIASDRLTELECENRYKKALLELTQLVNSPITVNFDVVAPQIDDEVLKLEPPPATDVFCYALQNHPSIMSSKYKVESSQKGISISKSAFYPTIILQAGYSNSYYYNNIKGYNNSGFNAQLRNNGTEFIGVTIRIPIFNQLQAYNNVKNARLNNIQACTQLDESYLELKKEIEVAYQDAVGARERFYAATKSTEAQAIVLANEERKYTIGKSTIFNFNEAKKQLLESQSEAIQAKYEYVFSLKIINYYMGNPLF